MNDQLWNTFVEGTTKIISDPSRTFLIKEEHRHIKYFYARISAFLEDI